jgi:chromate transporter
MGDVNAALPEQPQVTNQTSLREIAILFLRLGTTAFGGPAAHIAIMEDEFVRRRHWITQEKFLDLLGAVNLIPGPNSTEMAIFIGYLRAGWAGLVIAGVCFIVPAMLMVMGIAWAYVRFGSLPQFTGLLYGIKPVVIAVILQALWGLGRKAVKTKVLAGIGLLAVVAAGYFAVDTLTVILVGGVVAGLVRGRTQEQGRRFKPILAMLVIAGGILSFSYFAARLGNTTEVQVGIQPLFLYFLKIGSVLYGSGYVLLAFLQADLVVRWHWLTSAQLLDATAVGQVTPGPVFTTATFIGYVLGGVPGALIATVGIFLPSFVLIALSGPLIPRLRKSPIAGAFLDGVAVASLALMGVVTWQLGRAAIFDVTTVLLVVAAVILLVRFRINSTWLVLGGAGIGFLVQVFHIGG